MGGLNLGGWKFGDHGTNGEDALLTKVTFDIFEMPNREAAIALAFYGKDYPTPAGPALVINNDGIDLINKTPNLNLNFDEVDFLYDLTLDAGGIVTNATKK